MSSVDHEAPPDSSRKSHTRRLLPRSRQFWTYWFPWSLFMLFSCANMVADWCHASASTKLFFGVMAVSASAVATARALETCIDNFLAKRNGRST